MFFGIRPKSLAAITQREKIAAQGLSFILINGRIDKDEQPRTKGMNSPTMKSREKMGKSSHWLPHDGRFDCFLSEGSSLSPPPENRGALSGSSAW
jgi:hypothetical protein